jgi:hypothetical protein
MRWAARVVPVKGASILQLTLIGALTGCAPSPSDIRATPDDTWTWQIDQNYQHFAQCLTNGLNNAPEHSWFYQAPRPVTSFEQQWQRNRVVLRSVDPANIEQVRIDVIGVSDRHARVVAVAKNLQILGGGVPMSFVKYYVGVCAQG